MKGKLVGAAGSTAVAALSPSPFALIFIAGAVGLAWWAIWAESGWPTRVRHVVCGGVLLLGIGAAIAVPRVFEQERQQFIAAIVQALEKKSPEPPVQPVAAPLESPTLLVRYRVGVLPVSIAPSQVAYFLRLTPDASEWLMEVPNLKRQAMLWPLDPARKLRQPELMVACELTNHGTKAVLDLSILFAVEFFNPRLTGKVTRTKNPDGTFSVSFPHTSPERGYNFTYTNGEDVLALGDRVKATEHPISLPVIRPSSTVTVYIVSHSRRFISVFDLPTRATAIVEGQPEREVPVRLIRPRVNAVDAMPMWSLAPTTSPWPGLAS